MLKKDRKRNFEVERPILLDQEIRNHLTTWIADSDFRKLSLDFKDILREALDIARIAESEKMIEKVAHADAKDILNKETNRFISAFKTKYMELTDFEYTEKIDTTGYVIVRNLVGRLTKEGSSVVEYLAWFYDDFLNRKGNEKLRPPTIKMTLWNNVTAKFFFEKKDDLRIRKEGHEERRKRRDLMKMAVAIFDQTTDAELAGDIVKFKSKKIQNNRFAEIIYDYAKKYQIESIIKAVKKNLDNLSVKGKNKDES